MLGDLAQAHLSLPFPTPHPPNRRTEWSRLNNRTAAGLRLWLLGRFLLVPLETPARHGEHQLA